MKKLLSTMIMIVTAAVFCDSPVSAGTRHDIMSCSISVDYAHNEINRFSYDRDFDVSANAPYNEDIGTRLRFGAFSATMAVENSVPVVSIFFDRDVSAFNEVSFNAKMPLTGRVDSMAGGNEFRTSAPSSAGAHKTEYILTCKKAAK